jgi:site-specific recombinase XerD
MRIVKTQRILYNSVYRIRLIADRDDAEYLRLVRKLPDCRWSNHLNSWHTGNIANHIFHFNKVFPSHIRFYDVSVSPCTLKILEPVSEKRISVCRNSIENSLKVHFLYDNFLESIISSSGGVKDPVNTNCWIFKNIQEIPGNIQTYLQSENYLIDNNDIQHAETISHLQNVSEENSIEKFDSYLKSLNYLDRTRKLYLSNIKRFLANSKNKADLNIATVQDYIDELSIAKNYSRSYQNLIINSIKVYYKFVFGKPVCRYDIRRPSRQLSEPVILGRQEILKMIQSIANTKHQALISTIYMTGITVSETIGIKVRDFDSICKKINIHNRKGEEYRIIPVPYELHNALETYLSDYNPQNYLFEGYHGNQCSERSIQKVIKKYGLKAGIRKNTTARSLRHSFAGHKVDEGMDIANLQKYLGHKNSKSTRVYFDIKNKEAINFKGVANFK